MWLRQEIPRPTFVPSVTETENIAPELNEPVNPVSFARPPVSSSGSGETPMATPPGSGSYPLRDGQAWVMPRGSFPPAPLAGFDPTTVRADPVNFGGIISGVAKFVDNKFLGGAIQTIGGILDKPGVQKVLASGPKTGIPLPGTMPMLPALGGGVVKGGVFGDVRGGGSSTAERYSYGATRKKYKRMNPMNVKALRRAARRLESGEKLFRKVFSISHPGHGHSTVKIKRRKRA